MKFSGQSAIVAGAGGGMGLVTASELVKRGINVALVDIKSKPEDIPKGPGNSIYIQADLADEKQMERAVAQALEKLGNISYLVNTVGVLWLDRDKGAVDIDMAVWDQVFNINLRSLVLLIKKVIPEIKKSGGGAMVHFSSIDALRGDPVPQDAYGASKAALVRLSKSLAIQHASDNIRCNVILPGPALTPMQERWQGKPDVQARIGENIPLGRLGRAEDLANACLFLLSDNASWITGTELVVDGGITALP
jgi:3-oxoacyl-[acyl-carrier protein] reductase